MALMSVFIKTEMALQFKELNYNISKDTQ